MDDRLFCRSLRSKSGSATDHLSDDIRPSLYGWAAFRARLTYPMGLRRYLPSVTSSSPIGLQTRGVAALAAAISDPGPLLFATLPHLPLVRGFRHVLLAVAGDGIASAFPGGPGGGKVFSLWMKPVTLRNSHQSPNMAFPVMVALGTDSHERLKRICAQWNPATCFASLPPLLPTAPGETASPIVFCLGDLAFCMSIHSLPRLNRPFPTTQGRVRYFAEPMCWCCGVGGCEIYSRRMWRTAHLDRIREHTTMLGLRLTDLYYAPVHAVVNVISQLLCDLCHAHSRFQSSRPAYAAAAESTRVDEYIVGLFPREQWDPLLQHPQTRAVDARRSRRPFHHVDPAFIFGFLRDRHAGRLTELLHRASFRWLTPELPPTSFVELCAESATTPVFPHMSVPAPRSALSLWLSALRWFDSIIAGDETGCRVYGGLMIDLWFELLAMTRPIPSGTAVFGAPKPDFYVPVAGFGPATHIAVCSMPRLISFVRAFVPAPYLRMHPFLKVTAEIWVEHAQAVVRRTVNDFGISGKARKDWPMHILQRSLEGFVCRSVGPSDQSTGHADPVDPDADDADAPAVPPRAQPANRAYRECGLSQPIPADVYCSDQAVLESPEGRWFCLSRDDRGAAPASGP